ncbi:hypothetical protein EYR38_002927 [Pleurotus pulmonarius]|nr:hypothetical protein EYR38_002927 [Pleurotus pulmonarius]
MALHATSSSLRSSSAADEQPPESDQPRKQPVAKPPKRHLATPSPTQQDASIEMARNIIKTVRRLTESRSSKSAGAHKQKALAAVEERLKMPEVNEQVERLVASDSNDARDEIASTLAGMLEEDNADFAAELRAYNVDLSVIIKEAAESVEGSPASARYLSKAPSETSAIADSPDRSHQPSHSNRSRSLSSSGKSDFFNMSKNFRSFAIDSGGQTKELKAELSRALAERKSLEASWERERTTLQELADVSKKDKADYKQEKENLVKVYAEEKEKWESRYAADIEKWESRYTADIEKWESRHAADIEKWEVRHAEAKAEWQQQAKKWEDRYERELKKREELEEELKALRAQLRPSA